MKKRKNIKIIFNVFLSFILILLFFCGDLHVFAEDLTWSVTFTCPSLSNGSSYFGLWYKSSLDQPSWTSIYTSQAHGGMGSVTVSVPYGEGYIYRVCTRNSKRTGTGIPYTYYYTHVTTCSLNGGSVFSLSSDVSSPSLIPFPPAFNFSFYNGGSETTVSTAQYYFFTFGPSSTPEPTPTPAPTPTPLPVDYDDTQFWGRMNDMAEGGWSAITATFNGIFNNTVFRNLVVYVPLFGAIIYLFVYLLFMGSD